ncbi:SDR family oxidoreductase [Pendulispora brunnea]|uniref:SDR family oxidoreductase n=1 Tax=Pendulispora brunnea TaxID=2905690 RepID=A0ABZ2K638_9BACT
MSGPSGKGETIIVFGASSGVGEAVATLAHRQGARAVAVGRDGRKLEALRGRVGGVEVASVDASRREDVDAFFHAQGAFDHLVIALSGGKGAGAFRELPLDDVRSGFEAKFFPQLSVAQAALSTLKKEGGSITFISAASARSVAPGTAGLAAINAAIEAVIPVLALELAPIRVNGISPGVIDTPWWDTVPADVKAGFFERARANLPVRRVGTPEEVAELVWFLAHAGFVTGSVYEIDGGHRLTASRA